MWFYIKYYVFAHIKFTSIAEGILSLDNLSKDNILLGIEVSYACANMYFYI